MHTLTRIRTLGQLFYVLGTRVLPQQLNCHWKLFIQFQQFHKESSALMSFAVQKPVVKHRPASTVQYTNTTHTHCTQRYIWSYIGLLVNHILPSTGPTTLSYSISSARDNSTGLKYTANVCQNTLSIAGI